MGNVLNLRETVYHLVILSWLKFLRQLLSLLVTDILTALAEVNISLDSDEDFHSGVQNVSHL